MEFVTRFFNKLQEWPLFSLVYTLSVLVYLTSIPYQTTSFFIAAVVLVILAVCLRTGRGYIYSSACWCGLLTVNLIADWFFWANHVWVMWYWSFVLFAASLYYQDPKRQTEILVHNARWLLIIIMLVAVVWKVVNPDYMDGSFFERNLVVNPLMTTFTHTFTGLSWEQAEQNMMLTNTLFDEAGSGPVTLSYHSTPSAHILAQLVTWWVLLMELVIGVLLLFYRYRTDIWAHFLHMYFILCAYFAVHILAFAWILLVLGVACAGSRDTWLRPYYCVLGICLLLYALPWHLILFDMLGLWPLW